MSACRLNQTNVVGCGGINARTDCVRLHGTLSVGSQRGLRLDGSSSQPGLIIPASQDGGHAAVGVGNGHHQLIRRHANNRATLDHVILFADRSIPDRREAKYRPLEQGNEERLPVPGVRQLPYIEARDRQYTTLTVQPWCPKYRRVLDFVLFHDDGWSAGRLTFCPRRDEAPAHHDRFGLAVVPSNCRHILLCCDVESGREFPPRSRRQKLPLCGGLVGKHVALTHGKGDYFRALNKICDGTSDLRFPIGNACQMPRPGG